MSPFSYERLETFLADHLNMIYAAKCHLIERLPDIAEHANFTDLRYAIMETADDVSRQLLRMNEIFALLNVRISTEKYDGDFVFFEKAFDAILTKGDDAGLRDLSIMFYLQNIESMEFAAFQVLLIAAIKLKDRQIIQLLKENADEAKADMALFTLLAARYLNK